MGIENFEQQSGFIGQHQGVLKAGRLVMVGLVACVLLPMSQASAGECRGGKNYAPGTNTRQPAWDFLCAGADLLTNEFERQLWSDFDLGTKATDQREPSLAEKLVDQLAIKLVRLEEELAQLEKRGLDEDVSDRFFAVLTEIKKTQQAIDDLSKKYGLLQSVSGLPPDATLFDRMQRLNWWTSGGVTHDDQWSGPTRSRTTAFSSMVGVDMPVSDVSTFGFGIGYAYSAVSQDTTFAGTTDSNTLNLLLKYDWDANETVSFDMTAAYAISASHRAAAGGYIDDYLVSNIGLGLGVRSFVDLEDGWRVSGRLGWSGSLNTRYASTDSTNVVQGENTNAFSQALLSTKIEKALPDIDGSMFADGKLSFVLVDESLMNATASPFTLEFGAGIESQLNDQVSFNARGFVGSIGRADQTTFGGKLGLKMSF